MSRNLYFFPFLLLSFYASVFWAQTNVGGHITTNTTWDVAGSPYIILVEDVIVDQGVTLTVEAGVEVQWESFVVDLLVEGTLIAAGTATDSVRFVCTVSDPSYHGGSIRLRVQSTGNELRYTVIEKLGDINSGWDASLVVQTSSLLMENSRVYDSERYGIWLVGGVSPTIIDSRISGCNNYGLYVPDAGGDPVIAGNVFSGNGSAGTGDVFSSAGSLGEYSDNVAVFIWLKGPVVDTAVLRGGALVGGAKYRLSDDLHVEQGGRLVIGAGSEVQWKSFTDDLLVEGTLIAAGTATDSVRFVCTVSDPSYHGGSIRLRVQSTGNELRYTVIEKLGDINSGWDASLVVQTSSLLMENSRVYDSERYGIWLVGGVSPTIIDSRISGCNNYGLYVPDAGGDPVIAGNVFSGNGSAGTGDVFSSAGSLGEYSDNVAVFIWLKGPVVDTAVLRGGALVGGAKYRLSDDLHVEQGGRLVIGAGSEVQWKSFTDDLLVEGTLIAAGTATDSVRFVCTVSDPSYHGGSIRLRVQSTGNELRYTVIEKLGDINSGWDASLVVQTSSLLMENSRVYDSERYGIIISGANISPIIKETVISNSDQAINILSGNPEFLNCIFENMNTIAKVSNGASIFKYCSFVHEDENFNAVFDNTGNGIVDARFCWWGNSSGPYHQTLNPTGDNIDVSDRVWFNPWIVRSIKKLTINSLTLDTIPSDTIVYYQFFVPDSLDGASLRVSLSSSSNKGINEIYAEQGVFPLRGNATFSASDEQSTNREMLIFDVSPGIYYVAIFPEQTDPQNLTIELEDLGFQILSLSPGQGGNTGSATVKVSGSKFGQGVMASLESGGNTVFVPSNTETINGTEFYATFDLTGIPVGGYDFVVQKTNGDTAHWKEPFQVLQGEIIPGLTVNYGSGCSPFALDEIPFLFINIEAAPFARPRNPVLLTINFENQGTIDIPVPVRMLVSQRGQMLSFDEATIDEGASQLLVELREDGGPENILRAGASGSLQVYARIVGGNNEFSLLR